MLAGLVLSVVDPEGVRDARACCSPPRTSSCRSDARCSSCGRCAAHRVACAAISSASWRGWCCRRVFWIAGGDADGTTRASPGGPRRWLIEFVVAVALFLGARARAARPPRTGTSTARHLAERCALFIIIALGESLLVTGATFAELQRDSADRRGVRRRRARQRSRCGGSTSTPAPSAPSTASGTRTIPGGRHARLHLPACAHRRRHHRLRGGGRTGAGASGPRRADAGMVAILGGPALYLLGSASFKWVTNDRRGTALVAPARTAAAARARPGRVHARAVSTRARLADDRHSGFCGDLGKRGVAHAGRRHARHPASSSVAT